MGLLYCYVKWVIWEESDHTIITEHVLQDHWVQGHHGGPLVSVISSKPICSSSHSTTSRGRYIRSGSGPCFLISFQNCPKLLRVLTHFLRMDYNEKRNQNSVKTNTALWDGRLAENFPFTLIALGLLWLWRFRLLEIERHAHKRERPFC